MYPQIKPEVQESFYGRLKQVIEVIGREFTHALHKYMIALSLNAKCMERVEAILPMGGRWPITGWLLWLRSAIVSLSDPLGDLFWLFAAYQK